MTQDRAPFGRLLTAMVTPFTATGDLDLAGAQRLAAHLVDVERNDGLVISGTTGESPTTTDEEKDRLLRAVVETVGDRAHVVAGVGTNDTAHTVHLAQAAEKAGATGVLLVTPYYNRPPQAGLLAHFRAAADATGLPAMLYDIPVRTGTPIETETLVRLAEHPRIVAVKDAKGDLLAGTDVMTTTDLAYYCGDDALNLPWLSVGAVGMVSVIGHIFAGPLRRMVEAFEAGDVVAAREVHNRQLPLLRAFASVGGVAFAKEAMRLAGIDVGRPRLPLVAPDAKQSSALAAELAVAGLVGSRR